MKMEEKHKASVYMKLDKVFPFFKIFFWGGLVFKVFIEFVTILLLFYVLVFGCEACGILAPWSGIKPVPPALEGEVLTTGLLGLPSPTLKKTCIYFFLFGMFHSCTLLHCSWASLVFSGKETACQCRRLKFNPWVGKIPWRRTCSPLQYSCLENPMDRGAWWVTVHGVTKNWTRLSD